MDLIKQSPRWYDKPTSGKTSKTESHLHNIYLIKYAFSFSSSNIKTNSQHPNRLGRQQARQTAGWVNKEGILGSAQSEQINLSQDQIVFKIREQ